MKVNFERLWEYPTGTLDQIYLGLERAINNELPLKDATSSEAKGESENLAEVYPSLRRERDLISSVVGEQFRRFSAEYGFKEPEVCSCEGLLCMSAKGYPWGYLFEYYPENLNYLCGVQDLASHKNEASASRTKNLFANKGTAKEGDIKVALWMSGSPYAVFSDFYSFSCLDEGTRGRIRKVFERPGGNRSLSSAMEEFLNPVNQRRGVITRALTGR
ncbi:MAG: hypothetical protein JW727_03465 [Candidatus Aenigmarchaeota archaeon]|nr:hypothetical protein [Candidatus Aenigmarchaeota archaeon]